MAILVTGGAGFIGSNFVIDFLKNNQEKLINLDALTYAGNLQNLNSLIDNPNHILVKGDICDTDLVNEILDEYKPRLVINFAAESHVDRSIYGPSEFIQTNIVGVFKLLESVRSYWNKINVKEKGDFRFLHISTDEVYGSLDRDDEPFSEESQYQPNSPYSASKASSDHIVRAYFHTYGIPVLTTNCSNNYGPYQFPEKLIPLIINNALKKKDLPIYGDGSQIRDWLHVDDHCKAINQVLKFGEIGEVYNVGGNNEKTNLEVVEYICSILDRTYPRDDFKLYSSQITFVKDRAGHDTRYAINSSKIAQLDWFPEESFETGIEKTVQWYLDNLEWVENTLSKEHLESIGRHYI